MNNYERMILRQVLATLTSPRDRLRRLEIPWEVRHARQELISGLQGRKRLPHGGLDDLDQCAMLLQGLIGDPVCSLLDQKVKP